MTPFSAEYRPALPPIRATLLCFTRVHELRIRELKTKVRPMQRVVCGAFVRSDEDTCRTYCKRNPHRRGAGRPILDSGLDVGEGTLPRDWIRVDEPTSPNGGVWHLNVTTWLHVTTKIMAPHPGLYAAFFRVRQPRGPSVLRFSAKWEANATGKGGSGFLRESATRDPVSTQFSSDVVSWTHWCGLPPANIKTEFRFGEWHLVHIGNIYVRKDESDDGWGGWGGCGGQNFDTQNVFMGFGGENPFGLQNLEVDFAAIAPIRLSREIERLLWVGREQQQHGINADEEFHQVSAQDDNIDGVGVGVAVGSGGGGGGGGDTPPGVCLLAHIPAVAVELILEFSQPTLVEPEYQAGPVQRDSTARNAGGNNPGRWRVL